MISGNLLCIPLDILMFLLSILILLNNLFVCAWKNRCERPQNGNMLFLGARSGLSMGPRGNFVTVSPPPCHSGKSKSRKPNNPVGVWVDTEKTCLNWHQTDELFSLWACSTRQFRTPLASNERTHQTTDAFNSQIQIGKYIKSNRNHRAIDRAGYSATP